MGNNESYEYFDLEKPVYKVISDHIIKIDYYNDKKFHILIYDYDKNENVLIAVSGFLLVNHGQKILQDFDDPLLCWIYNFDDYTFIYKIKNAVKGKIRLKKITDDMI